MNTNQIQRFATQARNILLAGVNAKLNLLGFDAEGHADAADYPKRYTDSTVFQGRVIPGTRFYDQWMELYNRIILIGRDDVCEEAAYTWFNRLVALRILYKNGIIKPVVEYDNPAVHVPHIVTDARRGKFEYLTPADRQQLNEVIDDDTRLFEQFQVLITAYCHNHPILKACFGGITGYTELLLPNNILVDGNFIDLLNNTDYLTDDDYRQSELIGWLYQFYISEKKDEVFASFKDGNKAEADQIPAATQIFTPNWIVKYMVQNTAGRIYLDNHPNSPLKDSWKYLVEAPEPVEGSPSERVAEDRGSQSRVSRLEVPRLEDLTCADLSCGSGHILGEFFDLLYQIYDDELYDPRDAVEKILTHNILGIDLDTRAKQLSMFALLLKACQKDISFSDAHCLPRVLDMPKPLLYRAPDVAIGDEVNMINYEGYIPTKSFLDKFFSGTASEDTTKQVMQALALMGEAYNLGSIMRFELSPEVRYSITQAVQYWNTKGELPDEVQAIMPSIKLILALTEKYAAIASNPPYMGRGNMNSELAAYLNENYPDTKQDLFSTFMQMMIEHTVENGKTAFITMESWLFLSSFEKFRKDIIDSYQISSLAHFGWHIIGIAFGTAMTVLTKAEPDGHKGEYSYLTIDDIDRIKNVPFIFPKKDNGRYALVEQSKFKNIPGSIIGYWVSDKLLQAFKTNKKISELCKPSQGLATGDNKRFLRLWYEVNPKRIGLLMQNANHALQSNKKWFPYNKGGAFRKWYGNQDYLINWENDGEEIKDFPGSVIRNPNTYFHECISWSKVTAGGIAFRKFPIGFIYDVAGTSLFFKNNENNNYFIALLNSTVTKHILSILSPTLNYEVGQISTIPVVQKYDNLSIFELAKTNITISKQDWDAHETSWDFKENELIRVFKEVNTPDLKSTVYAYEREWDEKFDQLRNNEEELNRLFIEFYGLQDELSCEVPEEEVTILQQGEIGFIPAPGSDNWMTRIWYDSNIIQQFISYAIGCYMGRYRLDRPGLHIAHPNPTAEELAPYEVPELVEGSCLASRSPESFSIDEDAIIPILPIDAPFPDNAANRITNFVKLVFGTDNINENMNFIQDALGMSVADYMTKNFYTDHKKRYQNRPIYWLFSSKKGAFQCLVYMHRMNRFTVGRIRDNYLLPYIQHLETKLSELNVNAALLSSAERKEQKRKLAILQECREYDNILHLFADRQIDFDLDDGVLHNYSIFKDILAKLK